jgi:hypothetical protein
MQSFGIKTKMPFLDKLMLILKEIGERLQLNYLEET